MATNTNTTGTYQAKALPVTSVQYRHASGGTGTVQANAYVQACRTLASWARGTANAPTVFALVHLGWATGTGARATVQASKSAAYQHAAKANAVTVGQPAAPQLCATLAALAKAGAPAPALATVWATVQGKA